MRRFPIWSWLWIVVGALYFILPLYGTLDFSLREVRNTISLEAYRSAFSDPQFAATFHVQRSTVDRDWRFARAFLKAQLGNDAA